MREGGSERALRLIGEARREMRGAGARCEASTAPCEDELRYLNAETLNQAGRLDDAAAAFRALDRRGAPGAMRQNALFAAAQIERRQGRMAAAAAGFERALAAAPRGALYEDALVGAMESARAAGEGARARALAARYLQEFPRGLAAPSARRIAGDGAP
jgi:TolA-binding protein